MASANPPTTSSTSGPTPSSGVVATIPVGNSPDAATYDSTYGDIYVANGGSSNVSLLSKSAVVGSIAIGAVSVAVAYDTANGFVYVINQQSNSVSVINGTRVVDAVAVGMYPSSAA